MKVKIKEFKTDEGYTYKILCFDFLTESRLYRFGIYNMITPVWRPPNWYRLLSKKMQRKWYVDRLVWKEKQIVSGRSAFYIRILFFGFGWQECG
ncbi:MAG: hypothetical protein GY749_08030 [Desulfobacteraceae bacterium]|nr:hypothetical protein [Desulfobacteraceae bacterium]